VIDRQRRERARLAREQRLARARPACGDAFGQAPARAQLRAQRIAPRRVREVRRQLALQETPEVDGPRESSRTASFRPAAATMRGRKKAGKSSVTTAQASAARRSSNPLPAPASGST
jgi:hypothetical protein